MLQETGRKTALIDRLIARYGSVAARQKALFADEVRGASAAGEANSKLTRVPPYKWAD